MTPSTVSLRERVSTRARYLTKARNYFAKQQVAEVETPTITAHAVTDPHVDCLAVENGWLRPSPEYQLKRLLCEGSGDIYEIGRVYRAGEHGSKHRQEFTMVEWYRCGYELQQMIDDTMGFMYSTSAGSNYPIKQSTQLTYCDTFFDTVGFDPLVAETAAIKEYALQSLANELSPGIADALGNDKQGWLDLIMSHLIEPALAASATSGMAIVITHYPAGQALLSRLSPDGQTCERFEVFYRGCELANGFFELADAGEQLARFEQDRDERRANKKPAPEIDADFIAALERGLPDCSGVAVGLDRLIMSCEGYDSIADTLSLG